MNLPSVEPEYIVQELEKIPLTGKQLACTVQILLDLEVDLVVLYKELTRLEGISGRIRDSVQGLRLSLQERE